MVKMNFDEQGNRVSGYGQLLVMSNRGRGRPRKLDTAELDKVALRKLDTAELDKVALNEPANDCPPFQQKRGRGRPRKNPIELQSKPAGDFLIQKRGREDPRKNLVESDIPVNLKENYISDVKEKLKLLETITNGYREIERIDKETQKNVEKLCA